MIRVEKLERHTVPGLQKITVYTHDINEMDAAVSDCIGKQMCIELKPITKVRSRNANSYSWVLTSKLADKLHIDKDECHRMMLARYGQTQKDKNGDAVIVSVLATVPVETIQKALGYVTPIATHGWINGKEFIHYRVLKGSKEYTSEEMAIFIDGIVSECKEQGIETMPPDELRRMVDSWEGCK